MSCVPKDIANEYPEFADRLAELSARNLHFGRLCDRYALIERTLDRTRRFIEPTDDFHTGELRRQRLELHSQIRRMVEGPVSA